MDLKQQKIYVIFTAFQVCLITKLLYIYIIYIYIYIINNISKFYFIGHIIGLTGNALPEDIAFFQNNGANAVFIKPLNKDMFLEVIISLIA